MKNFSSKISTALSEKLSPEELKKIHRIINLLETCVILSLVSSGFILATITNDKLLDTFYIAKNTWQNHDWFLFRILIFTILFLPMLIVNSISLKLRDINCYISPQLDGKNISLLQLKIIQIILVCIILGIWISWR